VLPRQLLSQETTLSESAKTSGTSGWSIAAAIAAAATGFVGIFFAIGYTEVTRNNNQTDVKKDIINACQVAPDVSKCTRDMVESTNKLNK